MKLKKKVLITIGREYGSGGKKIAEALGKDLGIPVYDKNLLKIIATMRICPTRSSSRTSPTASTQPPAPPGSSLSSQESSARRPTRNLQFL